jgi:hypothetical protein
MGSLLDTIHAKVSSELAHELDADFQEGHASVDGRGPVDARFREESRPKLGVSSRETPLQGKLSPTVSKRQLRSIDPAFSDGVAVDVGVPTAQLVGPPAPCTGGTDVHREPAKNRIGSGFDTGGGSPASPARVLGADRGHGRHALAVLQGFRRWFVY